MSILTRTLLLLLLAVHESIQKSTPESLTYRAAVVEMQTAYDPEHTMIDNTMKIVRYTDLAATKDADIVVFPELCLPGLYLINRKFIHDRTTLVPDPSQNYVPCTNSSLAVVKGLRIISCAADRNNIYVVINVLEREVCSHWATDCPSDGFFFYITTVVFDREGKIIARYRKSHFDDARGKVDWKRPEVSIFDTDFGVTFGTFACFDIMFEEPGLTLTRERNITDIIYVSGWLNGMPFLNTIQMESGWAYTEDVNMLAAGHNFIEFGYSGSGIYAGRQGVLVSVLLLGDQEAVLVADVPKKSKKTVTTPAFQCLNQKHDLIPASHNTERYIIDYTRQGGEFRHFKWMYDKLDIFESVIIDKNGFTKRRLRHSGIDCEFQVHVTNLSPPVTYRLLAFDGSRVFSEYNTLGTKTCAIVHCSNDTIGSCGHVQKSSAIFHSIEIKASYVDSRRITIFPSTLGSDMLTLKNWIFDQHKQDKHVHTSISLTAPTQNVITFALWARDYGKDIVSN